MPGQPGISLLNLSIAPTHETISLESKEREQLGSLLVGDKSSVVLEYLHELRECSAKVLARSDQRNFIFVGRSPENIFDYLSGVFQPWLRKLSLEIK
jgi:hypothetical protein